MLSEENRKKYEEECKKVLSGEVEYIRSPKSKYSFKKPNRLPHG